MYIDSINSQDENYVISSFEETLINTQAKNVVKIATFPNGYNLDNNLSFNIMFVNGHVCSANDKPMTLKVGNVEKPIKIYSYSDNTTLVNLPMITVSNEIWTLKPNTLLELYYDGNQFIVVGNPIVYTTSDCDYYANGKVEYKKSIITTENKVNASCNVLLQGSQINSSGHYNVNTACGCTLKFNSCTGVLSATCFDGKATSASSADTAGNATCFGGCTYACAKADFRTNLLTMSNINANEHSLALCTGTTSVGISNGCPLKFNSSTGVLTATTFCGSLCGTADNASKFCNYTYDCAKADIRSGRVTISDSLSSSAIPIALCTDINSVGKSNCCEFTYRPTTGTLCVNDIYVCNATTSLCNIVIKCVCNLNPSGNPKLVCKSISHDLGIAFYCWNQIDNNCVYDYLYNDNIFGSMCKFDTLPLMGRWFFFNTSVQIYYYNATCMCRDGEGEFYIYGTCTRTGCIACHRLIGSNSAPINAHIVVFK